MGSYVRPLVGGWLVGWLKGWKIHFPAPIEALLARNTILLLLFTAIERHSIYPVFLLYSLYSITHRKKNMGNFCLNLVISMIVVVGSQLSLSIYCLNIFFQDFPLKKLSCEPSSRGRHSIFLFFILFLE